jgi:transcriptional regulator with XRE-family HTH domain
VAKKSMVGMTVESLGSYLRDQRVAAGVSLRQLAEQAGVSNPYLSQIERGLRRPSAEVLSQLAKALRISAEQVYVQAGILNPDDDGIRTVEVAVLADPVLTDRQKQALLEVYLSFRATTLSASEDAAAAQAAATEAPIADAPEHPGRPADAVADAVVDDVAVGDPGDTPTP